MVDCDGLKDVWLKNNEYSDVFEIPDEVLLNMDFGQIKVMVYALSQPWMTNRYTTLIPFWKRKR